jgi:hypothetical protein
MEAITSWALLLAAVGRATKHGGRTTLYLTPMHAAKTTLMLLIANIRAALSHVRRVAEQSPATDRLASSWAYSAIACQNYRALSFLIAHRSFVFLHIRPGFLVHIHCIWLHVMWSHAALSFSLLHLLGLSNCSLIKLPALLPQ